ncbi:hypothetical protein ACQEU5_20070 [Marinactinospora thermotolerans]|uniref:Secreted protein n=1 Tax=Marinactinospora thermotolerans DSM 45154 TaxID=1122192 RepID=A0A1T4TE06_9ACTN|nr:hypothetical protein [Marinactinospora thermotolerans]SKA38730.1 hypothetical protein SAMN02745673_04871 [Marinactinospora thermotolerans DSM 45154]
MTRTFAATALTLAALVLGTAPVHADARYGCEGVDYDPRTRNLTGNTSCEGVGDGAGSVVDLPEGRTYQCEDLQKDLPLVRLAGTGCLPVE